MKCAPLPKHRVWARGQGKQRQESEPSYCLGLKRQIRSGANQACPRLRNAVTSSALGFPGCRGGVYWRQENEEFKATFPHMAS